MQNVQAKWFGDSQVINWREVEEALFARHTRVLIIGDNILASWQWLLRSAMRPKASIGFTSSYFSGNI